MSAPLELSDPVVEGLLGVVGWPTAALVLDLTTDLAMWPCVLVGLLIAGGFVVAMDGVA